MMKHIFSFFALGCIFCAPAVTLNCNGGSAMADETTIDDSDSLQNGTSFTIIVRANEDTVVFRLNTGSAAKDLYGQLPLSIPVENYSNNEKIFHSPEKLSTATAPLVDGARAGTLAYYAPWGNVVMFYENFGSAPGLYELGHAISGTDQIQNLSDTLHIIKGVAK